MDFAIATSNKEKIVSFFWADNHSVAQEIVM